jgi:hypothetical protein
LTDRHPRAAALFDHDQGPDVFFAHHANGIEQSLRAVRRCDMTREDFLRSHFDLRFESIAKATSVPISTTQGTATRRMGCQHARTRCATTTMQSRDLAIRSDGASVARPRSRSEQRRTTMTITNVERQAIPSSVFHLLNTCIETCTNGEKGYATAAADARDTALKAILNASVENARRFQRTIMPSQKRRSTHSPRESVPRSSTSVRRSRPHTTTPCVGLRNIERRRRFMAASTFCV